MKRIEVTNPDILYKLKNGKLQLLHMSPMRGVFQCFVWKKNFLLSMTQFVHVRGNFCYL